MIVKKVKNDPKKCKLKAWQVKDLVDYIRHPHNKNPSEKIEYSGSRNFISQTHNGQVMEMISLANESVRSKMPVQHWILSWREGEQPTKEQIEQCVDIFLQDMGLEGHQCVFGLHYDTDNYHLHIAANRVHPETGKAVQPHRGFDIDAAHKILAKIENTQGWKAEENCLYHVLENGDVARKYREKKEIKPKQKALDYEHATGEKSAQRIAQERIHDILNKAESWEETHELFFKANLRYERKGSGAIILVGDVAVKASSVDRKLSLTKMEKQFGGYKAGNYAEIMTESSQPVSAINIHEWNRYQAEKQLVKEGRNVANFERISTNEREMVGGVKPKINTMPCRELQRIARFFLRQNGVKKRIMTKAISRKRVKIPRFETWLRQQGKIKEAERWRYKGATSVKATEGGNGETMDMTAARELAFFRDYHLALQADGYRVTCIRELDSGEKKTLILDKKNGVSSGFTSREVEEHFGEILRLQSRHENIYFTPLSKDNHFILVDDLTKERLQEMKDSGYTPAVILETSPDNFQCILIVKKYGNEWDKQTGNKLTHLINKKYGDPNLSGCIHPHRAPGFKNFKPKHRRENGTYPDVILHHTSAIVCQTAQEISLQLQSEIEAEANAVRQQRPRYTPTNQGSPSAAYYAHLQNIRQYLTIEDCSRADAMIAVRMRSTGHSFDAVVSALLECAPTLRGEAERRDWKRYAERTASYAFGVGGDREMQKNEKYHAQWRAVEGSIPADEGTKRKRLR